MDVPVRKHRQWGGSVKEPEFAIGWMLSSSTMHNVVIARFNYSSGCDPSSWTNPWRTNRWLLEPNLALSGLPRTSGAPKRAFWGQNEPFWGPQEYRRGPLRGQSTQYGCYQPSWTSQWQLGPNQAPLCLRRTSRAL